MINIYFIVKGNILIKAKKGMSVIGSLGNGSLLCLERLLKPSDP